MSRLGKLGSEHDVALMLAVNKHGYQWEDILKDEEFPFIGIWRSKGGTEEGERLEKEQKKELRKERKLASKDKERQLPWCTQW